MVGGQIRLPLNGVVRMNNLLFRPCLAQPRKEGLVTMDVVLVALFMVLVIIYLAKRTTRF